MSYCVKIVRLQVTWMAYFKGFNKNLIRVCSIDLETVPATSFNFFLDNWDVNCKDWLNEN